MYMLLGYKRMAVRCEGYPKQRFPEWDFTKSMGRRPLLDNDVAAPGKYEVNYGPKTQSSAIRIGFFT